tara:strand:- start:1 stop:249 length:249 start_codon:yes stop_codon:yes gene_type:complete
MSWQYTFTFIATVPSVNGTSTKYPPFVVAAWFVFQTAQLIGFGDVHIFLVGLVKIDAEVVIFEHRPLTQNIPAAGEQVFNPH